GNDYPVQDGGFIHIFSQNNMVAVICRFVGVADVAAKDGLMPLPIPLFQGAALGRETPEDGDVIPQPETAIPAYAIRVVSPCRHPDLNLQGLVLLLEVFGF